MKDTRYGKISSALLAAALIVLLLYGIGFGRGNIRLGKLRIEPSIQYELAFSDNIYFSNENEEDDLIHTLSPQVVAGYKDDPGNYLFAGYRLDMVAYSDADENNYLSHRPYLLFGYKSPQGFYAKIDEQFVHTEDPYGTENQYGEGESIRRWQNDLGLTLGYEFGRRYAAELGYAYDVRRFDRKVDEWQDRTDHEYSGALLYKLSPKTSIFGQYRHRDVRYDAQNDGIYNWNRHNSGDYTVDDFLLGVRFSPASKVSGELKTGYGRKEHDHARGPNNQKYEDTDSWVAEASLDYQMRERTRISLDLKRAYKGVSRSDADIGSYLDTVVGLELRQGIGRQLDMKLGGELTQNDYFNIYTLTSSLEWRIREWLRAGLGYQFRSKNADDSLYEGDEYDRNLLYFQVNALF